MKRYTAYPTDVKMRKVESAKRDFDTVAELAAYLKAQTSYIHEFMAKNSHSHLTIRGHYVVDNTDAIDKAKSKKNEDNIRQEALDQARAELRAELGDDAEDIPRPKRGRPPKTVSA